MTAPGLIVDLFAGGGGASAGIEAALGRPIDIAVNHDPHAIEMHKRNHPHTEHLCESVFDVDPVAACRGRAVDVLWASPDCKHHSRAKGGKPLDKRIRALAWVVVQWAAAVRPRLVLLENVAEFEEWGPLDHDDRPIRARRGETFQQFVGQLRNLGYAVEWRLLSAADYGAPTTRRRLFLVARRDGQPIEWPLATHGAGRIPWRTAAECIDWSIPVRSIFGRNRPLAEATLRAQDRGRAPEVRTGERHAVHRADGHASLERVMCLRPRRAAQDCDHERRSRNRCALAREHPQRRTADADATGPQSRGAELDDDSEGEPGGCVCCVPGEALRWPSRPQARL